ncbi:MAG: hypothetical protein CVV32_12555 [Methanomicrobiales archaeon HGW-Methanomicrobiales-3]|nr:MAG: hypothetical protein CVV32_12555 [Methanomicrobiales archaeon HGW-Methanomicrobiales-3]
MVIASLLILCLLVTAGCTSIPGPEPRKTTAPQQPTAPVTPQGTIAVLKTATPVTATPGPAVTPVAVQTMIPPTTPQGTYETRTCAEQGGAIARPGEMCPGTWIRATDSFSCCKEMPVPSLDRNSTLSIEPLDLEIVMDDAPGTIVP